MSKTTLPAGLRRTTREPPISVISSPPSGSGVSPFGLSKLVGGVMRADAGAAPMAHDPLGRVDLEDPAVADVGDDDVAVGERIGVVGRVQVAGARSRSGRSGRIARSTRRRRDVDAVDHLVALVVGDDRPAVGREERVVGREALAVGRLPATGNRHRIVPRIVDDQEPAIAAIGDQQAEAEASCGVAGGIEGVAEIAVMAASTRPRPLTPRGCRRSPRL